MNTIDLDLVTVLIAALVGMAIHYVWYSHWVFGPMWLKLCHRKDGCPNGDMKTGFWTLLTMLLSAYILARIGGGLQVTTAQDGAYLGFLVWVGFVFTTQVAPVIWGKKPFRLFVLGTGCKLLSYVAMGAILAA